MESQMEKLIEEAACKFESFEEAVEALNQKNLKDWEAAQSLMMKWQSIILWSIVGSLVEGH